MAKTSRSPLRLAAEPVGPATASPGPQSAPSGAPPPGGRRRLAFAGAAVLLAAADTYVVVLALTSIMRDIGIGLDQLEQATPIISGFLLGYVVVLPLLGRLSDVHGRRPVFTACLAGFAAGSVLTATANGLPMVVAGRTLQGLGGGGLVPVTLAMVADSWPPERRGLPLGVVGAVQELGSVLGPLYGAVIVAASGWRTIFWINLPLAALVGAGFAVGAPAPRGDATAAQHRAVRGRVDVVGAALLLVAVAVSLLTLTAPSRIVESDAAGQLYQPLLGGGRYSALSTPMALTSLGLIAVFALWETVAPLGVRPLLRLRRLPGVLAAVDWPGAALLGGVLGCIILVFAAADPGRQVLAASAPVVLPVAALLAVLFVARELRCADPLVDFRALRDRAAVGSLGVNLFVGAALMAALVDVPILARVTQFPDSQVQAALVLVRLLAAVPLGAVVGGLLCERVGHRSVAAAGMLLTGAMFAAMTTWTDGTLGERGVLLGWRTPLRGSDLILALCGLGFGLVIAPVNAAALGAVRAGLHGLVSSLVVVARMIGMLVGLSLLTAIGLHRFYAVTATVPTPQQLCPSNPVPGQCPAYDSLLTGAAIDELHVIFAGAAVCAAVAALIAAATLRRGPRLPARLGETLLAAGGAGG